MRIVSLVLMVALFSGFNQCEIEEERIVFTEDKQMKNTQYSWVEVWLIDAASADVSSAEFSPLTADDAFLAISVPWANKGLDLDAIPGLDARVDYLVKTRPVGASGAKGYFSRAIEYSPTPTMHGKPVVIVQTGSSQTVTTTITALAFSTVIHDSWSAASTPKITIPKSGLYSLSIKYLFNRSTAPTNDTGILALGRVNGTTAALFSHITRTPGDGFLFALTGEATLNLNEGDEVQFAVQKTTNDGTFITISTSQMKVEYLAFQ